MDSSRVILNDAHIMQRAENERGKQVLEVFDNHTMPKTIGELRRLLEIAWSRGFATCARIAAEKVKEWKEPPLAPDPPPQLEDDGIRQASER